MPARRNTAKPRTCRRAPLKKRGGHATRARPLHPRPVLHGVETSEARSSPPPLRGRRGGGRSTGGASAPPKSTNPISTKCTARNPCPSAPAAPPRRSRSATAAVFQPTDSRQSGPEFGPAPRSTGGAPGHRGGWKKRWGSTGMIVDILDRHDTRQFGLSGLFGRVAEPLMRRSEPGEQAAALE